MAVRPLRKLSVSLLFLHNYRPTPPHYLLRLDNHSLRQQKKNVEFMDVHPPPPPPTSNLTSTSAQTTVSTPSETHKEIRITNQGKMKTWIAAALAFFDGSEATDERTLVLHTLPLAFISSSSSSTSEAAPTPPPASFSSATLTVPRLISVAEIIKRQFIEHLVEQKSTREVGLFQYNEIGTLEELRPDLSRAGTGGDDGVERANRIIHAMGGQNHPRQIQTPYMRITLSTTERRDLLSTGASYQPPIIRKFSKSAKIRAKKRAKKAAKAALGHASTEDNMEL